MEGTTDTLLVEPVVPPRVQSEHPIETVQLLRVNGYLQPGIAGSVKYIPAEDEHLYATELHSQEKRDQKLIKGLYTRIARLEQQLKKQGVTQ